MDKEEAELSEMIQYREEKYFNDLSLKLNNPQTSPKTYNYIFIIKSRYNGRKSPTILHLTVKKKIVTNFKEKSNLFLKYFSPKCNPLPSDSKLPENQKYIIETNDLLISWMKIYTK